MSVLLAQTTIAKEFMFVDGITTVVNNWIFVWNRVNINIACAPSKIKPIKSTPPLLPLPTPPQKRADNPPTFNPPTPPEPQKPFVPPQISRPSLPGPVTSFNPPQIRRPQPFGPRTSFNPPEIKRPIQTLSPRTFTPQFTPKFSQQPNSFRGFGTVGSGQRASFPSAYNNRKSIM